MLGVTRRGVIDGVGDGFCVITVAGAIAVAVGSGRGVPLSIRVGAWVCKGSAVPGVGVAVIVASGLAGLVVNEGTKLSIANGLSF